MPGFPSTFHLPAGKWVTLPARPGRRSLVVCPHGSRIEIGIGDEPQTHGLLLENGTPFEWGNPPDDALWFRAISPTVVVVIEG